MNKTKPTEWEIEHYGQIIDDYETSINGGRDWIRQKVYKYQEECYIATWCNGYKLSFVTVI